NGWVGYSNPWLTPRERTQKLASRTQSSECLEALDRDTPPPPPPRLGRRFGSFVGRSLGSLPLQVGPDRIVQALRLLIARHHEFEGRPFGWIVLGAVLDLVREEGSSSLNAGGVGGVVGHRRGILRLQQEVHELQGVL